MTSIQGQELTVLGSALGALIGGGRRAIKNSREAGVKDLKAELKAARTALENPHAGDRFVRRTQAHVEDLEARLTTAKRERRSGQNLLKIGRDATVGSAIGGSAGFGVHSLNQTGSPGFIRNAARFSDEPGAFVLTRGSHMDGGYSYIQGERRPRILEDMGVLIDETDPTLLVATDSNGRLAVTLAGVPAGRYDHVGRPIQTNVTLVSPDGALTMQQRHALAGFVRHNPTQWKGQEGSPVPLISQAITEEGGAAQFNASAFDDLLKQWAQEGESLPTPEAGQKLSKKWVGNEYSPENRSLWLTTLFERLENPDALKHAQEGAQKGRPTLWGRVYLNPHGQSNYEHYLNGMGKRHPNAEVSRALLLSSAERVTLPKHVRTA